MMSYEFLAIVEMWNELWKARTFDTPVDWRFAQGILIIILSLYIRMY
jgi:hypothetical protein